MVIAASSLCAEFVEGNVETGGHRNRHAKRVATLNEVAVGQVENSLDGSAAWRGGLEITVGGCTWKAYHTVRPLLATVVVGDLE